MFLSDEEDGEKYVLWLGWLSSHATFQTDQEILDLDLTGALDLGAIKSCWMVYHQCSPMEGAIDSYQDGGSAYEDKQLESFRMLF